MQYNTIASLFLAISIILLYMFLVQKGINWKLLIGIIISTFLFSYFFDKHYKNEEIKRKISIETKNDCDKDFKKVFINYINQSNIQYKDITIKQALLETGHFKSNIFQNNNNCFGMKHPRQRETTSLGGKNNHAYYVDWVSSVKDFELWQKDFIQRNNISDSLSYVKRLNEVYSENLEYINILEKIKI